MLIELVGQDNDILKIKDIVFNKPESDDIEDMIINYSFKEQER